MRTTVPLAAALAAAILLPLGCAGPQPRVQTRWAERARGTPAPETPRGEEPLEVMADYPGDDEPVALTSLAGEEQLGEVRVQLGTGVYRLSSPVTLRRSTFVLEGEGPQFTRLELDTAGLEALELLACERVVLRDLTVVGLSGGGVRVEGCPDLTVERVHFVGARFGLFLESSTARVGTSVFAGCEWGIAQRAGAVEVRETAFFDCWRALEGRGTFRVRDSAFEENRLAFDTTLDRSSSVVGCVFAGDLQDLGWRGQPGEASSNLVGLRDLGDRVGRQSNRELRHPAEFPERLVHLPPEMDLPAVHLALERARGRGNACYAAHLDGVARRWAGRFAADSQQALRGGDLLLARRKAAIAMRYWGDRPHDEAPRELAEVAALVE